VEGKDLQGEIEDSGSLDEPKVRQILGSMCDALSLLWAYRIVHRDIKPSNILLRQDWSAIVIDLGVARHLDMTSITANGHWLGTPGYMSPEQANAQKALTVKSDIFALGITCYEALSGEHPFYRNQALIMRGSAVSPVRYRVSCSTLISDLFARMIERRPVLRPMPNEILRILENGR
jgi:serine/threonine-protein kinase